MYLNMDRGQKNQGTTIIEALVALLVLAVGLVGLAYLQAELTANNTLSKQRTEAAVLAQDILENHRSFGELELTPGFSSYEDIATGADTVMGANANYARSWSVIDGIDGKYKTVTVTVSWSGAMRENTSVSLSTVIARHDPKLTASHDNALPPIMPGGGM